MASSTASAAPATGTATPIVIDLGKQRRKAVRALRQGQGELMEDVSKCIQELQAAGTLSASAQPVIVIVRQRPRRRAMWPLP
jgi:hypothetical protein